jgi:hypothetical protein
MEELVEIELTRSLPGTGLAATGAGQLQVAVDDLDAATA